MHKICFLVISPLSKRDFKRFGIKEINNLNYEVLVLDCTPFLDKKFEEYIHADDICIKHKNVIRCYTFFQLIRNFLKFSPNWTVYFIPLKGRSKYFQRFLIRLIVKFKSKIIHHRTGAYPNYSISPTSKNKISKIKKKLKFILGKIIYSPLQILEADKIVVGGYSEFSKLRNKNKAIKAHNLDYDNFLEISRNLEDNNCSFRKLLFLDEDFPFHSDFFRLGISPELGIEYFSEMSKCLKVLGQILNLKPIIKLHPRANLKKSSKLYDIDIGYEDTAKLISTSEIVVAHCSTAIQLAVLFYKPIILIIPDKLPENSVYRLNINYFKNELGVPCIRSNEIQKIEKKPIVNFKKYDEYREKFIKMRDSEENFSWEIMIKDLSS